MKIEDCLRGLISEGVSDVHFKVSRPPLKRVYGALIPAEGPPLTPKETEDLALQVLGPLLWKRFEENSELDTSYSIPGFSRFRVSAFRQRGTISLALRIIPHQVPTLDALGLPPVVKELALAPRGLILVTGVTGSGKSSTLAGMVDHINKNRRCHVITIEDPIEFLHHDNLSSINQREIGTDTNNFLRAFRGALRMDPDVILVGELRDTETMSTAIRASETGHTVLSTIHTTDAKETVNRFVDSFPPHQHRQIRFQLAANLRAVVSQRLLERKDRPGLVLAAEVMVISSAIRDLILNPEKSSEIVPLMEKTRDQYGMQTFDQAIMELFVKGIISEDEAVRNATSPNDFKVRLRLQSAPAPRPPVETSGRRPQPATPPPRPEPPRPAAARNLPPKKECPIPDDEIPLTLDIEL